MATTVKKRKEKKSVFEGNIYIQATFNNTIVTITDLRGNAIAWASSGGLGFRGPNIVYHAAAHKHVPLMEDNPNEAVKNNVFGTLKTVRAADKFGTERFVLISTETAVQRAASYGLREVHVFVKGPGMGRENAIRVLGTLGLKVKSISDITPIPHNGCRPRKTRRM